MKVIEGKQIVFGTYCEVGIQTPKSIPTTSCSVVEAQERSAQPLTPLTLSMVKPREAGTSSYQQETRLKGPNLKEPHELHLVYSHTKKPEPLSEDALIPIHTESAKLDFMQVRNGQSEMTLEELFRIGRKGEEP